MKTLKVIEERQVLGKNFRIYGTIETPLFLAKDVAEWIDYSKSNVSKLVDVVDENEKVRNIITTPGGNQESWFLTEDGLYEVLMQSRKPIAKAFKKEVKEILKSIRKHGAYMTEETLEAALLDPDVMIQLCTVLKEERAKRKEVEAKNEELTLSNTEMKPKAEYSDGLVEVNTLTTFRDTAKELNVKETEFIQTLLDKKYIYRDTKGILRPYAKSSGDLFECKDWANFKTGKSGVKTMITVKGKEKFLKLFSNK